MSLIQKHFDKNNLHHAYLIEGKKEEILPDILSFVESVGVNIVNNPDFSVLSYDSLKIGDARELKALCSLKSMNDSKRVFVISANNFLAEAQNTLLKIFEEPGENIHFFVILPDVEVLLPTLKSRFYIIKSETQQDKELKDAKLFLAMPLKNRIDFIKDLIADDEAGPVGDTSRAKAIKFLNALETELHKKYFNDVKDSPSQICEGPIFTEIALWCSMVFR